jgi:hypothetical protein
MMVCGLFFPNSGLKLNQDIVKVGDRLEMKKSLTQKRKSVKVLLKFFAPLRENSPFDLQN